MAYITQYDISADPYELRELNPLVSEDDGKLLDRICETVPAYQDLSTIDTYLATNANSGQPLFFLVKGVDGCGRSSVANWILARYRKHRQIPAGNFIVPGRRKFTSNDSYDILKQLTGLLIDELDDRDIAGIGREELRDFAARRAEATATDLIPLRGLLRAIGRQLQAVRPSPFGFGVCIEDLRVPQIIEDAFTVFGTAPAVCIFIVGDYEGEKRKVIEVFEANGEALNKRSLRLIPLDGASVGAFICTRWHFAANDLKPHPFPADLESAFSDRDRSAKRVVFLMNQLLDLKTVEYEDKRWDTDRELSFTLAELNRKIRILDQNR